MTGIVPNTTANISGKLVLPNGTTSTFTARKTEDFLEKENEKKEKDVPAMVAVTYPNISYGLSAKPKAQTILFKNATVWTGESDGVLQNTDVLIKDGKITKIGQKLSAS